MRCLHLNIRQATFMVLCTITNNISLIQMAKDNTVTTDRPTKSTSLISVNANPCPEDNKFHMVHPSLKCNITEQCRYGEMMKVQCRNITSGGTCSNKTSPRQMMCRFCYQTESWEHTCKLQNNCNSITSSAEMKYYVTNCTVNNDILCLGNRVFKKKVRCNWTGGYRWSTALILSITLGGFGADRFYLGHWQEGIGKLFSFGGLGVWTLIDVILISLHYLGPADGSLYI